MKLNANKYQDDFHTNQINEVAYIDVGDNLL